MKYFMQNEIPSSNGPWFQRKISFEVDVSVMDLTKTNTFAYNTTCVTPPIQTEGIQAAAIYVMLKLLF